MNGKRNKKVQLAYRHNNICNTALQTYVFNFKDSNGFV